MIQLDSNIQLRIAGYCNPRGICAWCQTCREAKRTVSRAIPLCLPYTLCNLIGIQYDSTEVVEKDMHCLQEYLLETPCEIVFVWKEISDALCRIRPPPHRGAYRRQSNGFNPIHMDIQTAKQLSSWESISKQPRLQSSFKGSWFHHEVYRMDRLRVRVWRKNAPLAMSLIY